MIRHRIERSFETWAKRPVHFSVVKSSLNVRGLSTSIGSPEDEATYVRWRRGLLVLYGSMGLLAMAVAVALGFFD
jgi:hypothetical protein